jgi:hypothetical protein
MRDRSTTPLGRAATSRRELEIPAWTRELRAKVVSALRQKLSSESLGTKKLEWTFARLVAVVEANALSRGMPTVWGSLDDIARWSKMAFDSAPLAERQQELGTSAAGGALASTTTWDRMLSDLTKRLPRIQIEKETLADSKGALHVVSAELVILRRRGKVAIYVRMMIDGVGVPIDPWHPSAHVADVGGQGASDDASVVLEWFLQLLKSVPFLNIRGARRAIERNATPTIVLLTLLGLACGGYFYYRATHHIQMLGGTSVSILFDATHAPRPAYFFCWQSKGNEPKTAFRVLRDGEDVSRQQHVTADELPSGHRYCFEDSLITVGPQYVYRVAVGWKMSGPVIACADCAARQWQALQSGEPLQLQRATKTEPVGLAAVGIVRTFNAPFVRQDRDGKRIDPASRDDAPGTEWVLADYGDGPPVRQQLDHLEHRFDTPGERIVTLTGLGLFAGQTYRTEIDVIAGFTSEQDVYTVPANGSIILPLPVGPQPEIIVYACSGLPTIFKFRMPPAVRSELVQHGGIATLSIGKSNKPLVGLLHPGPEVDKDLLVAEATLHVGEHRISYGVRGGADGKELAHISFTLRAVP